MNRSTGDESIRKCDLHEIGEDIPDPHLLLELVVLQQSAVLAHQYLRPYLGVGEVDALMVSSKIMIPRTSSPSPSEMYRCADRTRRY
jgi:hypothetical protein